MSVHVMSREDRFKAILVAADRGRTVHPEPKDVAALADFLREDDQLFQASRPPDASIVLFGITDEPRYTRFDLVIPSIVALTVIAVFFYVAVRGYDHYGVGGLLIWGLALVFLAAYWNQSKGWR